MDGLQGRRLLVVGASSGVGRASAIAFAQAGADVAFAARRTAALHEAVEDAGTGHVVAIDVLDQQSVDRGVAEAAERLDGTLDGILYTAGMSPLATLAELTVEQWHQVLGVNTIGPSLVIGAALPVLSDDAIIGVFSSDSSSQPRHSLVAYGAAKRALEATMEGWRTEVLGGKRFVTILLGPTQPTEFADAFPPEAFAGLIPHWTRQGFHQGIMNADEVAAGLCGVFGSMFSAPTFGLETVLLRAPEPDPAEIAGDFGIGE